MSPQPDRSGMRQEDIGSSTSEKQRRTQRSFLARLLFLLGIGGGSQTGSRGCALVPTISVALVAVIIIGIIGVMVGPILKLIPPFAPGLTINGTVVPGGTVVVHGTNFPAGNRINLRLDGVSISLAPNSRHSISQSLYDISLSSVQVSPLQQTEQPSSSAGNITVRNDGTFDVQVSIPKSWQLNSQHIISAQVIGQDGSVQTQAQQTVTIEGQVARLTSGTSNTTPNTSNGPSGSPTVSTNTSSCTVSTTGTGTELAFSFSGAAPCYMNVVGNGRCNINAANFIFEYEVTGTVNGKSYTFQIVTGAYINGPGTYTTMTIDLTTGSSLNVNQGWVTRAGTVTVNGDEKSGSVDALMNYNQNTSGTVDAKGNWACS